MIPKDCKRLAEVDFPIAEVSKDAGRTAQCGSSSCGSAACGWRQGQVAKNDEDISDPHGTAPRPNDEHGRGPWKNRQSVGGGQGRPRQGHWLDGGRSAGDPARVQGPGTPTGNETPTLSPIETTPGAIVKPQVKGEAYA